MELFLRNPDQTLSRSTILSRIWGADYEIEGGNLDNYIYFVRRRLRKVGGSLAIKTVHGIGYRLSTEG
jgi:DNA-binding response OmpR family regulator